MPTEDGSRLYATEEGVESQAANRLLKRFRIARNAPICTHDKLFDDFGYLGDCPATANVLSGEYEFPPDMDPHTKLLPQETHQLFSQMPEDDVADFVTTQDSGVLAAC